MLLARFQPIAPVLLGITVAQLALGALGPLIALLLAERAVTASAIGLVTSAYYGGFLAGSLSCPRIVDRVGHIRAFAVFAALAADCVLLHAVTHSPAVWGVLRAITGYAMAGSFLIAESWLNTKADSASRGRIFGAYLFATWSASAAGPLALNLAHQGGGTFLFILIALGFVTALVPMALTQVANPEIAGRARFGVRRLFQISPTGVVACCGSGLVNSAFYGLLPVYAERTGLDPGRLSLLLTTALVGGLLAQFPIGMISDRFGRRPTMLVSIIIGLLLALAVPMLGRGGFPRILALAFLLASVTAPLYGLGAGQTNDYIAPKDFVGASAGLLFAWALGASVGPLAASAVMEGVGAAGLFLYLAVALAAIAAFTIFRMLRRSGLPVVLQGGFVPSPQTPPRIAELDPRSAEEAPRAALSD